LLDENGASSVGAKLPDPNSTTFWPAKIAAFQ
jgi:hypothetical protein